MAFSVTELTTYTLEDDDEFWGVNAPAGFIVGSKRNRACWVVAGKVIPCGIREPIHTNATPHGLSALATAGGNMTGTLKIRESFYRELTDEESNMGEYEVRLSGLSNNLVTITSTTQVHEDDLFVSHRIFHLNYVDDIGKYKKAVVIPYTGGSDSLIVNLTADDLVDMADSPSGREWSILPAGETAEFMNGRLHVARQRARALDSDVRVTIAYKETSTYDIIYGEATLSDPSGTVPASEMRWIWADVGRGIVDETTGYIYAYVDTLISDTIARVIYVEDRLTAGETREKEAPPADKVLTQWHLTSEANLIYTTGISTLGASGNVRYHMCGWNPLDQIRNENLYTGGAKIERLIRVGEELVVVYTKGIGVFQGSVTVGAPPVYRSFVLTEGFGTVATNGVWKDINGALWVWGSKRLVRILNGIVEDVSVAGGYQSFFADTFDSDLTSTTRVVAAYNPDTNVALLVGGLKIGEAESERGKFGVALCHDSLTLHPLRFPRALRALNCFLSYAGNWEFWAAGKDRLYQILKRGLWTDTYYSDAGALTSSQAVTHKFQTGVHWWAGRGKPCAVRFIIESALSSGINLTFKADLKDGNIHPAGFTADVTETITHTQMVQQETVGVTPKEGYAVQYEVSGSTSGELTLVAMIVFEEVAEQRGWKELVK